MSIRTSIILVVTLLMVSGYVFFVQIGTPADSEEEPPWFYSADMSDMARISITSQEEEITFYLADDQRWHIESEDGLPVGLDRWGGVTLLLSGPKSRSLISTLSKDDFWRYVPECQSSQCSSSIVSWRIAATLIDDVFSLKSLGSLRD